MRISAFIVPCLGKQQKCNKGRPYIKEDSATELPFLTLSISHHLLLPQLLMKHCCGATHHAPEQRAPLSPIRPGGGLAPGYTRQTHIPSTLGVSENHLLGIPFLKFKFDPDFQIVVFTLDFSKFCAH